MSYSKPWIHKAAWRSLQLLRSRIHLFLIEISSVLSHTQSYPLSISKAYLGLAKPQSHVLDVRQIRSVPSKCAEREKHLPLHIWFPSFYTSLPVANYLHENYEHVHNQNKQLTSPSPSPQLQTRSQHDVTPISWSAWCELLTWSMILPKSVNPALCCPC